jgi:outer membrane protein assembly factor BamA
MMFCLTCGQSDKWLEAGARADSSSAEEERIAAGGTISSGIRGRMVGIAKPMKSVLLSINGNIYFSASLEKSHACFSIVHVLSCRLGHESAWFVNSFGDIRSSNN